ncbi:Replicative DNA helicase [Candidatus Westeberhardia cardiocondylae]|uniref:Replicative DNA helicase n=1 Tax=Candidatus Westeberhardia cardiocondylae TaxID=1594731 RepID=A0A0H5BXA2_9ENTR|nr:replicative DNA helicase [Candidatus Westeberhardia cardiocondylae]CEN32334.1 Replicative DNA helicase [Candidatus Westeberhardia cardiocondylae]
MQNDQKINQLKIPPHSIEAEQSILGGLMLDNNRWDDVFEKINENNFFHYSHKLIFLEMQNLLSIGKPIDLITLSESLEKKGTLQKIGGFSYLAELSKNIPSAANIIAYADIVRERSIIREIISVANKIADAGYNPKGRNSEDILDFAESNVFQIAEHYLNRNTGPKNINHILNKTIKNIEKLYNNPYNNGITGISSGYQDVDKKTAGLQKSDLIIIAARPAMGKTTFAINLCENISMTENKPALIFSLEMSSTQIIIKIIASLSRVNQTKIRTGKLKHEDWTRVYNTANILLKKNNIYIDDSSDLTPITLKSRARRIFKEHGGLSVIMIDYLQLMRVPTLSYNRTLEITEISRSLKELAKELQVPIIALSQLNRSLEQRFDKRPINSDLRESGSIEQDADLIMFIYRDELYNEKSEMKGIAEIIFSKQRNGPTGTIKLTFNGQWSRFDNYANI